MHSIPRILVFSTSLLILTVPSLAQQEQDKEQSKLYMEQADLIMRETQAMDDARDLMIAAANYDTTNAAANFNAGYMYLLTTGKDQASKFLLRAYRNNPDYRFDIEYQIARSYQYALDFDKAIEFFNLYKSRLSRNLNYNGEDRIEMADVDRKIYESENGKEYVNNPSKHAIVNMGREINSEYDDYAPVLNENEDEIVFTTRRRDGNMNDNVSDDNKPFEDIFFAKKTGGKWGRARNIGDKVNTLFNESNLALSPDGKSLFIYRDENSGDVYFSTLQQDGSWTVPVPLPGDVNSTYRETSVSVSKDGNTLYFASDRPGGLGGSDIYVSTKNKSGEWTRVKNMGPKINTELDEDSPFIDYDGTTLYFSSEGKKGMGGFDIYKVTLVDEKKNEWSEPENLGYPINTPDNDIFYVGSKDSERGYYSSVRDDGMGYSDIYVVTTEPEKYASDEPPPQKNDLLSLIYEITVVDADTKKTLKANVSLQAAGKEPVSSRTLGDGEFVFNIKEAEPMTYNLSVEMDGYVFQNLMIEVEGASKEVKTVSKTVEMKKLVVGVTSVLHNIYFDYGTAKFREESYDELNKLENMMRRNDKVVVEIAGHTDNVSSASFNKTLSQKRADAVRDFLVSKGISTQRVTAVGYGEERPMASNDDEKDGRELNRRVEFKVLNN